MLYNIAVTLLRSEYYQKNKAPLRNNVFAVIVTLRGSFQIFSIITIALNVLFVSDVAFCRVTFQASQATVR